MCGSSGQLGGSDNMSNEDMSGEISEARRRALEASVAPGADIYLSYEESEALWAASEEVGAQMAARSSVVRTITLGPALRSLHRFVTEAPKTAGVGGPPMGHPLFGISPVVSSSGATQVPAGQTP